MRRHLACLLLAAGAACGGGADSSQSTAAESTPPDSFADGAGVDGASVQGAAVDGAGVDRAGAASDIPCPSCATWNTPQQPFQIYGNTYYVGTRGLSAILITSSAGHVLIDGGLPESSPIILASIRALGFDVEDIELILNSHPHFDHAGGIAALRRASGATVAASPSSALVLERGESGRDDPQFGSLPPIEPVSDVQAIADGDTLRVGTLALTARFTPGHTPGGTSWSWQSCQDRRCLDLVYADSQTPVSADGFFFSRNETYPMVLEDFERGFAVLEQLECDILLTPHPGASSMWERIQERDQGVADSLIDPDACRRYAANARQRLAERVASEQATP